MKQIGIDGGGSLIKIVYEENGVLHYKTYGVHELESVLNWLWAAAPDTQFKATGGKSSYVRSVFPKNTIVVEEFHAVTQGAKYLLRQELGHDSDPFLLVSIGTGTSVYYVNSSSYERVLGSGIGGGTLIGLGSLISGESDFHKLISMAQNGNRMESDLLVKDIYAPADPPLLGDLTASNFGKAHTASAATEDYLASLIQLIGETIILLVSQAAQVKKVSKIVFVGSTLDNNEPLKIVLESFRNMLEYEPIYLEKGAFAGAIGALLNE